MPNANVKFFFYLPSPTPPPPLATSIDVVDLCSCLNICFCYLEEKVAVVSRAYSKWLEVSHIRDSAIYVQETLIFFHLNF